MLSPSSSLPLPGFEGVEKKLEIEFTLNDKDDAVGLRALGRDQWQSVLDEAQCRILSVMSNENADAYVLSESSLFVFRHRLMLKTCGTTTLLHVIPKILAFAKQLDLPVEYVAFARKALLYPECQRAPHTHFEDEIRYLDQFFAGDAYVLGPVKGDYWFLYRFDATGGVGHHALEPEVTVEIMMHDLDEGKMRQFFKEEQPGGVKSLTRSSGIDALIPGSRIDDFLFEPCGYSMNGLRDNVYWTIHVTPEAHCSYVSFETNVYLEDYTELVRHVLQTFSPGRFTVTVFADDAAIPLAWQRSSLRALNTSALSGFRCVHSTFQQFDATYNLALFNFVSLTVPPACGVKTAAATSDVSAVMTGGDVEGVDVILPSPPQHHPVVSLEAAVAAD